MAEKLAYTIPELLEIHPSSRAFLYQELAAKRLTSRKMGSRTIVLREDYEKYLRELPVAQYSEGERAAS